MIWFKKIIWILIITKIFRRRTVQPLRRSLAGQYRSKCATAVGEFQRQNNNKNENGQWIRPISGWVRPVTGTAQTLWIIRRGTHTLAFFFLQRFLVSSSSCPGCPSVQFKFSQVMWSYFHWRDWLWHPLRLIRHGSHGFAFKGHHTLWSGPGLAIWAENPWMYAIILILFINFEDTEVAFFQSFYF